MEKDKKIIIKQSKDADTRSAEGLVTKKQLLQNTYSHISDVNNIGNWLVDKFVEQLKQHDHTKVDYIDEFYEDFTNQLQADNKPNFKEMPWFKNRHMTERHHLNDSVPDDVNLLDVLEMVIDCTSAGLARSGNVYDITIPVDVLNKAINNTKQLIIDNTEVDDNK